MIYTADALKSLFSSPFDETAWTKFLHVFLGATDLRKTPEKLAEEDDETGFLLGEFMTNDGYRVGLFRFEITHGSILRSKSGLRALADRYLKNRGFDAAIAVFVKKGEQTSKVSQASCLTKNTLWRFSYICDIKDAATAPRRFTYVFGDSNQSYRTPIERFTKLQSDDISREDLHVAFSVEALSKQFYNELFQWYEYALTQVRFPADLIEDDSRRNAEMTIRLVSRLLFCWFLKQKTIIPGELFDKTQVDRWLNHADSTGSTYYKAVLQNLFFATLNLDPAETPRAFVEWGQKGIEGYRYKRFFKPDQAQKFIEICAGIPFLNGGLFECLDRDRETTTPRRLDCFSNQTKHKSDLVVPDALFFDDSTGLIPLLNRYNFTIEENTPLDQEIALDPELLGKVFENLLATYNPETGATARKSTGSFYTPREIVDYMADESVKAALTRNNAVDLGAEKTIAVLRSLKILDPACGSGAFPMGVLNNILARLEAIDPNLDRYETKLHLIENCIYGVDIQPIAVQIAKLRFFISLVCDWPDGQTPPLPNLENNFVCANTLVGITGASAEAQGLTIDDVKLTQLRTELKEKRHAHFSARHTSTKKKLRKEDETLREEIRLRLVEIATKPDSGKIEKWNGEIDRLCGERNGCLDEKWELMDKQPEQVNLFGDSPKQQPLRMDVNKRKRDEIDKQISKLESDIRKEESKSGNTGFIAEAERLASWNPYDQNASASFFDPEWMFVDIKEGFDIVIGNPPYVQLQNNGGALANLYKNMEFQVFERTGDIYTLFYERGWQLLRNHAHLCFITSNKWMRAGYGESLRKFFAEKTCPQILMDFAGQRIFESATVDTNILLYRKVSQASCLTKNDKQDTRSTLAVTATQASRENLSLFAQQHAQPITFPADGSAWVVLSSIEQSIKAKIEKVGMPLKEWDVKIYRGILTGLNDAFIISKEKRDEILANCETDDERQRTDELIRPILRGRDIKRYSYEWANLFLIATHNGIQEKAISKIDIEKYPAVKQHLDSHWSKIQSRTDQGDTPYHLRSCAYMDDFYKPKIVWGEISDKSKFAFDNSNHYYVNNKCYLMTGKKLAFLTCYLNSFLAEYLFSNIATTTGVGTIQWSKFTIEQLLVPRIGKKEKMWEDLLYSMRKNEITENDVNHHIYVLCDLSSEEILFIENYSASI